MGIHYDCARSINISGITGWRGLEIYFGRVVNPPPLDSRVEDLRRDYERAVRKLHLVAGTEDEFMKIFNPLLDGAHSALVAMGGTVEDGRDRLKEIEHSIVKVARAKRGIYFVKILGLGLAATLVGISCAVLISIVPKVLPLDSWGYGGSYRDALAWLLPACLVLPGASLGIIFVGFATQRLTTYEKVGAVDQYDFTPWQRFVWVIIISYVLLAALWFKIFVLGVGNIELNKVVDEARYGFLIGLICGVAEATVVELLASRLQPAAKG
jgi:hypothetical protein